MSKHIAITAYVSPLSEGTSILRCKKDNKLYTEVTKITENRRRDKTLTIRLTDTEKKKIIAKSRKAKMSATDFIIASTDNAVIKTPEDLRPVVSQLKRIGNNINQIAVKVNSGAVYSVNFDEVIEMQNKIYEKIFEIANADSQVH